MKSRIQALRQMNESAEDYVNYEGQSAYDVADMLKQYFRDLPEPLMTNKLSETFLQIYQCKHPGIALRLVALSLVGPTASFHVILLTRKPAWGSSEYTGYQFLSRLKCGRRWCTFTE